MNPIQLQNECHAALQSFANGRPGSSIELLESCITRQRLVRRDAGFLVSQYRQLTESGAGRSDAVYEMDIDEYNGDIPAVFDVARELDAISQYLKIACVHGSLASNDTIAYSDFDAFVVVSNAALQSVESAALVAAVLQRSLKHMYRFDPLQHHGWLVLTEFDLENYCDAYLPVCELSAAKSILPGCDGLLRIRSRDSRREQFTAANSLLDSVEHANVDAVSSNLYALKSYMSRIMLLPAMYLQAIGEGSVSKSKSFGLLGEHINDCDFHALNRVSEARRGWDQELGSLDNFLLTRSVGIRALVSRLWRVNPGRQAEFILDSRFQSSLSRMILSMRAGLTCVE